jgi:preprotein translocase subunit YajC
MHSLVPILLMIVVFYLFMLRPQAKRQKERQQMLAKLGVDDLVITRGGVIGRVRAVRGDVLDLEVHDQVRLQVPRAYVEGKWTAPAPAQEQAQAAA